MITLEPQLGQGSLNSDVNTGSVWSPVTKPEEIFKINKKYLLPYSDLYEGHY
jgi:hypothetical protein